MNRAKVDGYDNVKCSICGWTGLRRQARQRNGRAQDCPRCQRPALEKVGLTAADSTPRNGAKRGRYNLVEIDGQLEVVPAEPTPAMRKASRRNGSRGGRPKGSGQGRAPALKRHLTVEGDDFLAQVRDEAGLKSHAEALDMIRTLWGERISALIKGHRKKST